MINRIFTAAFVIIFGVIAIIDTAEAAQFTADGLVTYYTFDDVDGDTVIDAMGNHDGTIIGDLEETDGYVGKAFEYLRAENEPCIIAGEPGDFSCVDEFTWSAWIQSTGTGGSFMAMTAGSDVPDEKTWQVTGTLSVEVCFAGVVLTGSEQVNDDDWHYVAMTYDPGTLTFYVDGKEDATGGVTFGGNEDTMSVRIGNDPRGNFEFPCFDGIIDEVAIYDRTLDSDEIEGNFEAEALNLAVSPGGKLAGTWGKIKVSR